MPFVPRQYNGRNREQIVNPHGWIKGLFIGFLWKMGYLPFLLI